MNNDERAFYSLDKMIHILSETGTLLISNGANSTRTARNLKRIAETYGFTIEQFFSHSAVVLTVGCTGTGEKQTLVKSIPHYAVNYSIVSEVSILSWEIAKHRINFERIEEELEEIRQMNSYSEWQKTLAIGIATASLCQIFSGTPTEFFVAFFAAVAGVFGRRLLITRKYNVNISWFFAAFVSTSVVNLYRMFTGSEDYHGALTACVLWLIPGVPLINGFLDILSNHVVSGWAKIAMGFLMIFMIAVGFYLSLFIFGYGFSS